MEYRYLENGKSLRVDAEKCIGCGICAEVCPHDVFGKIAGAKAEIFGRERCMECGACALNCPTGAIRVNRGVGCAAAIIGNMFGGKGTPGECSCDPSDRRKTCC